MCAYIIMCVCVHMYVCIYIYIYTHTYTYAYIHTVYVYMYHIMVCRINIILHEVYYVSLPYGPSCPCPRCSCAGTPPRSRSRPPRSACRGDSENNCLFVVFVIPQRGVRAFWAHAATRRAAAIDSSKRAADRRALRLPCRVGPCPVILKTTYVAYLIRVIMCLLSSKHVNYDSSSKYATTIRNIRL